MRASIADAALGASRRGEVTAAAAATYASRGRLGNKQVKGSRGRPTTAPVGVGRRGKKLMPLGEVVLVVVQELRLVWNVLVAEVNLRHQKTTT